MEILIPAPRTRPWSRTLVVAAALCVPALGMWLVVALDRAGVWSGGAAALAAVPEWGRAAAMFGGPLASTVLAVVDYARRARRTADRRPLALSSVAAALIAVAVVAAVL